MTAASFAAVHAPLYLGDNLGSLIVKLIQAPAADAPALLVWGGTLLGGVGTFAVGAKAMATKERGELPLAPWIFGLAAASVMLIGGWTLPQSWGLLAVETGRMLCFMLLAASFANLGGSILGRTWLRGLRAANNGTALVMLVERVARERDDLAAEVARLSSSPPDDLIELVDVLGGRRSVLAQLHPDRKPEAEKLSATRRFQLAINILDRAKVR